MWTRIIDGISARLAFFPPTPPSYILDSTGPNLSVKPVQSHLKQVPSAKVHRLPIRGARNEFIVAAFVPSPGDGTAVRFTLLHSHGNAVDLGQMLPLYEQMARLLKVNILTYDYRGYGMSTGSPAASATFQDINTAFRCLLDIYNLKARDIVLYGQSLGSGPTSWLASKTPGIAGVVLHSPFLSGLRVLKPSWKSWPAWADIFPNFKYAPKIESKTIIIHGTRDEVVDSSHGRQLHRMLKNSFEPPFWAEGSNHQNVESHPMFIPTMRKFLTECFGEDYARQFSGYVRDHML